MTANRPPERVLSGKAIAAIVLCTVAALAVLTGWLLVEHDRGAAIANVLALPVGALALMAAIYPIVLQRRGTGRDALAAEAVSLAKEVYRQEAVEQNRLLADTADSQPANIDFGPPPNIYWRADGGPKRGTLAEIAEFYAGLERGRLIILGEPGAGKTVLANQLLLDQLKLLFKDTPETGRFLVPVRFSLPAFDAGSIDTTADQLSDRFDRWIIRTLREVHTWLRPATASALVKAGWILPVLDGLDEMDAEGHAPVRAAAMMRLLNEPTTHGTRRVVVTCREHRYQQLTQMTPARVGEVQVLQDATAVSLEPLAVDEVSAYLIRRFRHPTDPDPTRVQDRWRPVITEIQRRPKGAVARTLRSPLRLFMAVTAYAEANPRELLRIPAAQLDDQLLRELIPAVAKQHRDPQYAPEQVTKWLASIAGYLHRQGESGGSESDLELHLLWTAAGRRKPRYIAAALLGLLGLIALMPPFGWYVYTTGRWTPLNASGWYVEAFGLAPVAITVLRASQVGVNLQRLDVQAIRSRPGRRRLRRGIARWLAVGMSFGVVFTFVYGPAFGAAFGVACGAAFGVAFGLERKPAAISRPSALLWQGAAHDLVVVANFGIAFGLANGLVNGLLDGLVGGITFGLSYGVVFGLAYVARSPWPRYFVAMRLLARNGEMPSSPARFLDWAHRAGLLRQSGIACQFRHRELQDRLLTD